MRAVSMWAVRVFSLVMAVVMFSALVNALPRTAEADPGPIPQQRSVSANGKDHKAPTTATTADEAGTEHDARPADGLPEDKQRRNPTPLSSEEEPGSFSVGAAEPSGNATGYDAKTSRELPDKGSRDRQVFANADGTETTRYYTGRQMYRDGNGEWRKVDSTLVGNGAGWQVKADAQQKRFAPAADAPAIATVELAEGKSVGFGVANAARAVGAAAGSGVTYTDVRRDADLKLDANPMGIKETIVLKSADAPTVWDFPLQLDGLTAKLVDGAVQLSDTTGELVGMIPRGYMEDANVDPRSGDGVRSDDVTYQLLGEPGNQVLRVSVDAGWVADPDRQFPILVDPTVTSIDSNGDTYVMYPYTNDYSTENMLKVGTWNGGSNKAVSLLRFNVGSLNNNKILDASLNLYSVWSYSCNSRTMYVRPITSSWRVSGNKSWPGPSTGSVISKKSFAYGYSNSCGPRWVNLDVTGQVHKWTHGTTNNGLRLSASGTDSHGWKKFSSANTANAPYLQITHNKYWAEYSNIAEGNAVTPTSNGSVKLTVKNLGAETWTPTNEYKVSYRLWDREPTPDNELSFPDHISRTSLSKNVAHGQTATLYASVKKLPPGSYRMRMDMVKSGVTRFSVTGVPMSPNIYFTVSDKSPVVKTWSPPSGFQSDTVTPTLSITGDDPDNYPGTGLKYRFKVCESDGTGCFWSAWSSSESWTVPAGKLSWGKDYRWYGQVDDGNGAGPYGPAVFLTTRVAQPAVTSHLGGQTGGGVDPEVGNFTAEATDATVSAVGPTLAVERTYNSQDPRKDLAFGEGWSTSWDTKVEVDDDGSGNVVVTFPDGRQGRYGLNPDGTYATPPGQRGTLVATASGWTLRDVGDVRYQFDAGGRLVKITDAAGHAQTLSYDATDRLDTATDDTSGRSLDFTWTGSHVTTVTTGPAPALSWTYTYDGDRLSTVCNPEAECTAYTYQDGSGYRSVVVDTNPRGYWRLADAAGGTVASEISGLGTNLDGTANAVSADPSGPLQSSPVDAAAFDGASSYVRLAENPVRGRSHRAVELWFKTTSGAGGVLFNTSNFAPGATGSSGSMPVLYVGTDGKLYGHFCNTDVTGIVGSATVNDGAWHHVVLSQAGSAQTLFLDGKAAGTQDTGHTCGSYAHNYFGAGLVTTNDWPARPTDDWGYFDGSIAEAALYHRPIGEATVADHHAARIGASKLTTITHPGRTAASNTITYDPVIERVAEHVDANGGGWLLSAPVTANAGTADEPDWQTTVEVTDPAGDMATYVYDPTRGGRVMSVTDGSGAATTYEYDTGGFPYRITDPNGHITELRHDERGNELSRTQCRAAETACFTSYREYFLNPDDPLDPRNDQVVVFRDARSASSTDATYATTYDYHPNGELKSVAVPGAAGEAARVTTHNYTSGAEPAVGGGTTPAWLLASVSEPGGGTTTLEYTSAGDLATETDAVGLVTKYGYDGIGRKTSETTFSSGASDGSRTTFTYDGASRLVEELEPVVTNTVTGTERQQKTVHAYNPDGTVRTTTVSDAKGTESRTTSYGYDSRGRQTSVTDAEGAQTTVEYNSFGDVVKRLDALGTAYGYTYTPGKRQLWRTTIDEFTGGGSAEANKVLESRSYDPAGRVATSTDALGNTTEYKYFDDGLLESETLTNYVDPKTNETRPVLLASYEYSGNGEVTLATRGDGQYATETSYDPGGRPVRSTEFDGDTELRSTVTTFDALDNPTEVSERNADGIQLSRVTLSYDKMGREISRTDYLSDTETAVTETVRDERGLPIKVIDPRGAATGATPADYTTEFGYDALGQLVRVTAPPVEMESDGGPASTARPVSKTGYNAFGEVTHSRDANGNVTRIGYDKAGRQISTTLPDYVRPGETEPTTATVRSDYDPLGRVIATVDPAGNRFENSYDELGNLRRRTDPPPQDGQAGATTVSTYTATGLPLTVTGPNGTETFATYDELGRQITQTVTERQPTVRNLTTRYTYDNLGNPETVTSPMGLVTTFEHDDLGNPTKMVDPSGVTTTAVFDALGRPVKVMDPKQSTLKLEYDLAGRNTAIHDLAADGTTVLRSQTMSYDVAGNRTRVADAAGGITTQKYDALGQLTEISQQISDTKSIGSSFGYDKAGNLTRATDGNGNTTVFGFNAWGLPESTVEAATAQTPAVADRTYTTSYDVNGRVATLTKPGGVTISNNYDALGNLVKQTGTGTSTATPDRTFGYDKIGRVVSASAPGGANTYTYNDRGLLLAATGPSGSTTFAWDDDGRLTSTETGAGTAVYDYEQSTGRLASAVDPLTQATATYGYDTAGRVAAVSYGSVARSYDYDEFGRLDRDTITSGDIVQSDVDYGYDKADRLTSKTTSGVAGSASNDYTYDLAGRLASWNDGSATVEYGWDGAGNLVSRGGETATFNERNQLLKHGDVSYTYTPRGTMASRKDGLVATAIEYNAFDQLVSDGGTDYAYDGLNRLVQASGKALEYVGTSIDVAYDGTRRYTYTPDGQVLGVGGVAASLLAPAEPAGLGWTDLHTDLVGVVDPTTGELHGSRSYDPFGEVIASDGVQPGLGYQHQFTDPATGNVNMGARWYQPETGTFASRDNAALDPRDVGNANRYAYAGANPLTQLDPAGYFWGSVWNGIKKAAKVTVSVAKEVTGYNDLKGCIGGSWGSCGWFVAGLTPIGKVAKGLKYGAKALGKFGRGSSAARSSSRVVSKVSHYGGRAKASYKRVSTKLGRAGHAVAYSTRGYVRGAVRGAAKGFARSGGAAYQSSAAAAAAARAAAAAAAEAARLAARRAMVHRRAVTPAAKPPKTASVSPSVQAKLDAANNQPAIDFGAWGVGDDAVGAGGRAADEVVPAPMEPPVFSGPASGGMPGVGSAGPPRPDAGLPSAGPKALPSSPREPPNVQGVPILSRLLEPGEEFNMVLSAKQPVTKPGGFGTTDNVPDQNFAREGLAIRTDWKTDVSLVQRYRAPASGPPIRVQESIVGPQNDPVLGLLPGGATQLEILNFSDRSRLLPIGKPRQLR